MKTLILFTTFACLVSGTAHAQYPKLVGSHTDKMLLSSETVIQGVEADKSKPKENEKPIILELQQTSTTEGFLGFQGQNGHGKSFKLELLKASLKAEKAALANDKESSKYLQLDLLERMAKGEKLESMEPGLKLYLLASDVISTVENAPLRTAESVKVNQNLTKQPIRNSADNTRVHQHQREQVKRAKD